jgi:hypothetical protein
MAERNQRIQNSGQAVATDAVETQGERCGADRAALAGEERTHQAGPPPTHQAGKPLSCGEADCGDSSRQGRDRQKVQAEPLNGGFRTAIFVLILFDL